SKPLVLTDKEGSTQVTAAAAADGGEKEEEEEKKRLDEFGDWLETQELPDEFKIQVAGGDSSSS
ncbi:unnamed protein product, partial [Heterosigma akashiwo]